MTRSRLAHDAPARADEGSFFGGLRICSLAGAAALIERSSRKLRADHRTRYDFFLEPSGSTMSRSMRMWFLCGLIVTAASSCDRPLPQPSPETVALRDGLLRMRSVHGSREAFTHMEKELLEVKILYDRALTVDPAERRNSPNFQKLTRAYEGFEKAVATWR